MASGYMFSHYWPGDGLVGSAPPTQVYPYHFPWFNHTTVGMFGAGALDTRSFKKRLKGAWVKHIWRRFPLRWIATFYALRLIWSPSFSVANWAVRQTAQEPESRSFFTWGEINQRAVSNPAQGENIYRNFSARLKINMPLSGPLLELAWIAWKKRGR